MGPAGVIYVFYSCLAVGCLWHFNACFSFYCCSWLVSFVRGGGGYLDSRIHYRLYFNTDHITDRLSHLDIIVSQHSELLGQYNQCLLSSLSEPPPTTIPSLIYDHPLPSAQKRPLPHLRDPILNTTHPTPPPNPSQIHPPYRNKPLPVPFPDAAPPQRP